MRSRPQQPQEPDRRRAHGGENATTWRWLIGRGRMRGDTATAALGPEHRLVCLQARIRVRVEQATVVAAGLAASAGAITAGARGAMAALVACAVTEVLLALSAATLLSDRRACALQIIAQGHDTSRHAIVERERRRLLAATHRRDLARSLHALADEAPVRLASPSPRPLYTPRVLTALAAELHATAQLLCADHVAIAGLAASELLLTAHDSPLYGTDAVRLRQELHRIRFALKSTPADRQAADNTIHERDDQHDPVA
jgi:hypothetical protein